MYCLLFLMSMSGADLGRAHGFLDKWRNSRSVDGAMVRRASLYASLCWHIKFLAASPPTPWTFRLSIPHGIRLLTLTGARLSEVLHLRWGKIGELSENGATARLTDSKTGPRTIWLGPDAARLLARLPRDEHAVRIFPEAVTSDRLYRFWCEVREQAGLSGLRIHDCRHTWASQGLINGVGLTTVGRLLGHRRRRTTAIYAHLDDTALRDAAAQTALVIARAMRYTARPQSDNASGDSDDELPHRPEPEHDHVTRVRHPKHDALNRKVRVLPADASTKKAVNPETPDGFFRI